MITMREKVIISVPMALLFCIIVWMVWNQPVPLEQTTSCDCLCPSVSYPVGAYEDLTGTIYIFTALLEKNEVEWTMLHEYGHYLDMNEEEASNYANTHYITVRGDVNE